MVLCLIFFSLHTLALFLWVRIWISIASSDTFELNGGFQCDCFYTIWRNSFSADVSLTVIHSVTPTAATYWIQCQCVLHLRLFPSRKSFLVKRVAYFTSKHSGNNFEWSECVNSPLQWETADEDGARSRRDDVGREGSAVGLFLRLPVVPLALTIAPLWVYTTDISDFREFSEIR